MSKQYAADKENQRDRTVGMRSAMGDGSFKGLSLASRKDLGLNVDKSARLVGKKDAIKLTPSLLQNPLVSANIQNYTKKLLANASRNDEITKDTSIPQRKNYGPPGPKSSLLSNYLSRDKDLRLNSRSKPKREEESERRVQHELLQPSKSNMQIGNLNTKIQNILQPIKKAVKKARETNDMSSMSNVSEISDVSRNNRHHYARESDLQAYKSTEKSSIANFGKDKKAFFSKKPAPKPSKPVPKKAFASVNKSRMSGSSYSIETTPDKVDKNTVLMMDKIKPMLSNALSNTLAMRVKDNAATVNNTSKVVRMKNEKLVCLENLVVKNELGISIKTQERFIGDSGFLTKGIVKRRELTIEEEIKNFVQENQGGVYTSETLGYMIQSEAEYMPDPYYLDKNQNEIKWKMRAMLLDWLIEVCADFTLKISTFHYAVNYIDRYLSIVSNIQKSNFQLVGLTALSLATKIEEVFVPHLSDFAVSASNIFSVDTIKKMELNMLKSLKWKMTPPTLHTWANWYTCQWDYFIENSPELQLHPLVRKNADQKIMFRLLKKESYYRYREMMQFLDCSLLEVQTLQYKLRPLVASFMYIILGKDYGQFDIQTITEVFPTSSLYLLDKNFAYNDLFGKFLDKHFGFQLEDLLPCIQYASTFFSLPVTQHPPPIVKLNPQGVADVADR